MANLYFRITEAVDDCVQLLLIFTQRTVMYAVGAVIRDILLMEDGMNRKLGYASDCAENCSDCANLPAVIQNT